VATLITIPVAGPKTTAGAMIKTLVLVAVTNTELNMSNNSINPGVMTAVPRVQRATGWVVAMSVSMNHDLCIEDHAY